MKSDTKILFTDLDGTLLTSDKKISSTNMDAIKRMTDAGHKFVVATGRPLLSAYKLCEQYGFVQSGFYIIASNGGVLYDCSEGRVIDSNSVPFEHVSYIFEAAADAGIHVHTYSDEHVISLRQTDEVVNYTNIIKMPYKIVENIPEDLEYEPPKVIVISHDGHKKLDGFRASLESWAKDKIQMIFSASTLLEFLPLDSTKGNGVSKLCKLLDIPIENAIACGDEENDISMIQTAGIGVVMQNGTALTKSHADYITNATNNEDGIAEVIYKFILQQ